MFYLFLILGIHLHAGAAATGNVPLTVPLDLIVLKNGAWGPETVYPHVERAQRIFARCGIRFAPVKIDYAEAPGFARRPPFDQELAEAVMPGHAKPALFFFDGAGSEAYGEDFSDSSPRKILEYTGWIASQINTPDYVKARHPAYDTVAHEIAHMLCNCGHTSPGLPNLLSGQAEFVNDEVTPQQCEQFRASPLVHREQSVGV